MYINQNDNDEEVMKDENTGQISRDYRKHHRLCPGNELSRYEHRSYLRNIDMNPNFSGARIMKNSLVTAMAIVIFACGAPSQTHINKGHHIGDEVTHQGSLRSVNGSITVGNSSTIQGNCSTVNGEINIGESSSVEEVSCVNGSIYIDRNSQAQDVSCVNGSIKLGSGVTIAEDVSTVNGSIRCGIDTRVSGDLETVNGDMVTEGSSITGNISTVNGDIDLIEGSVVSGNIVIDRDRRKPAKKPFKELTITINSNSIVEGDIEVKGDEPNVTVVLAGGGEVRGEIINARIVRK